MSLDEIRSSAPGIRWPAVLAAGEANRLSLLYQLEQSQWWTEERLRHHQLAQLREVVGFAAATMPWYREHWRAAPDAAHLDWDGWQALPLMTRSDAHRAGEALRSGRVPAEHGRVAVKSTSGSTGMVVTVAATELSNLFWQAFCLREHLWQRRDLDQTLMAIRYRKGGAGGRQAATVSPNWGSATDGLMATGEALIYSILDDVDYLAEQLRRRNPGYLLSHPSVLEGLARRALEQGWAVPGLREVRSFGESLPSHLRDLVRQAWGVEVVDAYSCQEAGYLALQCPDHPHYHVQSENVLLEVLDRANRPCAPGEVGRVVITTLNNFASPLIRYELGDYAEVGGPCPCGRGLPVLKRVLGRHRNLLSLPDGSQRWPRLGYEGELQRIAPVRLMQMIQHSLAIIEVRLVMDRPLTAAEQGQLSAFIHDKLGHPFELRFSYVDDIRNPVNGKLEQFINRME